MADSLERLIIKILNVQVKVEWSKIQKKNVLEIMSFNVHF